MNNAPLGGDQPGAGDFRRRYARAIEDDDVIVPLADAFHEAAIDEGVEPQRIRR